MKIRHRFVFNFDSSRCLFFGGLAFLFLAVSFGWPLFAEEPSVSYIFPAGGQRGKTVHFKVGGHYLLGEASFEMIGDGVKANPIIHETNTVWFEGPIVPLPASQQLEDYPKDHAGAVQISPDAEIGERYWRVWTSQGATPSRPFVIGDLPELVEEEIDGNPIPVEVKIPVTINGRIFPREDVDIWNFTAKAGQEITCEVAAKRIGSPLEARLELRDPQGRRLAEAIASANDDPRLSFKVREDGLHQIRIHDLSFGGLQHFVYRLTITSRPFVHAVFPLGGKRGSRLNVQLSGAALPSKEATIEIPLDAPNPWITRLHFGEVLSNPIVLEADDLPEFLESETNQTSSASTNKLFSVPAIFNGRIALPGAIEQWPVRLIKDQTYEFDLRANRLGSALDSVLAVLDSGGKQLAENDDISGEQADSRISFKALSDGIYLLQVKDRFSTRGGPFWSYRLRASLSPEPDFRLKLSTDAVTVLREVAGMTDEEKKKRPQAKSSQIKIDAERVGGFVGEILLQVDGLPQSIGVKGDKIAEKQNKTDLTFAATPQTKIGVSHISVRGRAKINGRIVEREAALSVPRGKTALTNILLAVAMPTPFKVYGDYLFAYGQRGSVYHRRYHIDRAGFKGELKVRLADRQVRHLQGVQGPTITVTPAANEFDYPLSMPPWMEIGRTSRSAVMVSGTVKDSDGNEHLVCFASGEQNDQIIAVVMEGLLSVEADRGSLLAEPNAIKEVRIRIQRDKSIDGATVKLELITPSHFQDVRADPVLIPPGGKEAMMRIQFGKSPGPFNMPALVRATTLDSKNPQTAETQLEFVLLHSASAK